jgi:hypothetical protein
MRNRVFFYGNTGVCTVHRILWNWTGTVLVQDSQTRPKKTKIKKSFFALKISGGLEASLGAWKNFLDEINRHGIFSWTQILLTVIFSIFLFC